MKKRIKEIEKRLEVLEEIVDKERDRIWKQYQDKPSPDTLTKVMTEIESDWCKDEWNEISKLYNERSLITPIELEPLDDFGDLMTIEHWVDCVKCGGFIDYDGDGVYATETQKSNKFIKPSHVKKFPMRDKEFTHIVWYNR